MKLYVGNLPYSYSEKDLEDLFSGFSLVENSVKLIRDRDTGKSKGFGFVEIADKDEAQRAITELNGKQVAEGRALVVNEARPQEPRSPGGFSRSGGGGMRRDAGKGMGDRGFKSSSGGRRGF